MTCTSYFINIECPVCSFPSKYFYEGKLKNGLALEKFRKPYHKYKEYSPLVFYDLPSSQKSLTKKTLSYQNESKPIIVSIC